MEIYLNNSQTPLKAEILPTNTPTKDETLETFSFALISNNDPLPLAPMQSIKVVFDEDEDPVYFYIVNDSVETYSLNPLKYKHSLSCIQNTRKLSKHLTRNSVFSQPANPIKESFNSVYCGYHFYPDDNPEQLPSRYEIFDHNNHRDQSLLNIVSKPLTLTNREKIKNIKVRFDLSVCNAVMPSGDIHWSNFTWTQKSDRNTFTYPSGASISFFNFLRIRYKNSLGQTITSQTLTPSDLGLNQFEFNVPYNCSKIEDIFKQGGNDVEILFDDIPIKIDNASEITQDDISMSLSYILSIYIVAETYYYSAYDVLNLLIERQKKETSINSLAPLFSLPESGELYDLLKNTVAPNFAFTQFTMYECVADVFRLFDAIFTMDENGVLGIEYFNDLNKETIEPKLTGRNLSHSEDKYTNGLISYYQDARTTDVFPSASKFAHLRDKEFGVGQPEYKSVIVNYPISSIDSFKVHVAFPCIFKSDLQTGVSAETPTNTIYIELKDRIVETSIWTELPTRELLDTTYYDNFNLVQITSLSFERNSTVIDISYSAQQRWGLLVTTKYSFTKAIQTQMSLLSSIRYYRKYDLFFSSVPDWKTYLIQVTYKTSVDGMTKIHTLNPKYDGESLVDQYNGAVDLNKMGLNMLGLSLKLGNPTLNATHKITKWADRIKTGQLYEYKRHLWLANVVSYTFFNGHLQGKVSFVQNFNALSLRTQLLRDRRMSNISKELTQKSEEILTNFIYYSTKKPVSNYSQSNEEIYFNSDAFADLLFGTFSPIDEEETVKFAAIYNNDETPVSFTINAIYIPLIKYGAGNTINFEMSFESPIIAGNQTNSINNAWFGTKDYYTQAVKYTDDNGFLDKISIQTPKIPGNFDRDFPKIKIYKNVPNTNTSYFDIKDFKVYKQPNEIFAVNYQLAFLPFESEVDFLGSQFINDNAFIKEQNTSKKIYICFKKEKSSVLDTKPSPYFLKKTISLIQTTSNTYFYHLIFNFSSISLSEYGKIKSWCLVDENENILFASNRKPISTSYVEIYFITKKNRI